jgi:hypothetical protein
LKDKSATRCLFFVSVLVIWLTCLLLIFCCHSDAENFLRCLPFTHTPHRSS